MSEITEDKIRDLFDETFTPDVGFEGPFPVPYSQQFAEGVKAGWRAALIRLLQMLEEENARHE